MTSLRTLSTAALGAMLLVGLGSSAVAQRDPEYARARAAGEVGEQTDGYLGIVGTPTPELRKMVAAINIKRKEKYIESAGDNATAEQFAFTTACNLIKNTEPGEKYQAPNGTWKTRTAAPPERDPRCL